MARKLEVEIVGDASSLKRALGVAESGARSTGGHFSRLGKAAALAGGAAGIGALIGVLKVGADEFSEHAKVAAQTGAVLKSTGGSANITAKEIDSLAGSIMKKSGIDDEAIQSGENMLLTFTNIRNEVGAGNDIFNQSTSILTDMSTALGTDMSKSAIQLGKALNDPIAGVGALARVGVTFTDAQKDTIRAMVESGNTMGAQKLILHELNKEFGGSAEAAGKTLPGQLNILKQEFSNVAGEIVTKLVPALTKIVTWVSAHWPEIESVMKAVFSAIGFAITKGVVPAIEKIIDVSKVIVDYIKQHWPEISAMAKRVFGDVKEAVQDVVKVVTFIWEHFGDQIVSQTKIAWEFIKKYLGGVFQVIQGMVEVLTGLLHGNFGKMWDGIKDIFSGQTKVIQAVFEAGLKTLVNLAATLGEAIKQALLKPIATLASDVAGHIADVGKAITGKFSDAAKWGEGLGEHVKDGVVNGLKGIGSGAWDIVNNVGEVIAGKAGAIKNWGENVGSWVKGAVGPALTGIGNAAWDVINNIGSVIAGKAGAVKDWGGNIGDWIKGAVGGGLAGIGGKAWDVINNIGATITDKLGTIRGWGDHIASALENGLKEGMHLGVAIASGFEKAYDTVHDAIGDLKKKIVHWLRDAFDWFSPSGLFEELGQDMMRGLAKGILGKFQHPMDALKWIFKMVGKEFPDHPLEWLQNTAGRAFGLVTSAAGAAAGAVGNVGQPPAGTNSETQFAMMHNWVDANVNRWPYTWGGGHGQIGVPSRSIGLSPAGHWYPGVGYDCSGFVSGALHAGGLLNSPVASGGMGSIGGTPGRNSALSVAYTGSHTFLHLSGVNYGTGWGAHGGAGVDSGGFPSGYNWTYWPQLTGRGTAAVEAPAVMSEFTPRDTFLDIGTPSGPSATSGDLAGLLGGGNVGGFWKGTKSAPGGWAWVGERGPELMYVPRGAQVVPNDRLPGGSGGMGSGAVGPTVVVNLHGPLMGSTVPEVAQTIRRELVRHGSRNGSVGLA